MWDPNPGPTVSWPSALPTELQGGFCVPSSVNHQQTKRGGWRFFGSCRALWGAVARAIFVQRASAVIPRAPARASAAAASGRPAPPGFYGTAPPAWKSAATRGRWVSEGRGPAGHWRQGSALDSTGVGFTYGRCSAGRCYSIMHQC